jgi:hypothetical protein
VKDSEIDPYAGYQESGIPETLGYLNKEELSEEKLKSLKKKDSYGYKKLLAETYLFKESV